MIRHFPRHLIHCLPSPAFSISLSLALSLTISPSSSLSISLNILSSFSLKLFIYLSTYYLSISPFHSLSVYLTHTLSLSLPLFLSIFQDIDSLLEQRAHVLVTENAAQTESWLNKRKKATRAKYVRH